MIFDAYPMVAISQLAFKKFYDLQSVPTEDTCLIRILFVPCQDFCQNSPEFEFFLDLWVEIQTVSDKLSKYLS